MTRYIKSRPHLKSEIKERDFVENTEVSTHQNIVENEILNLWEIIDVLNISDSLLCFYYGSVFNKFKKTQLFDLSDSLRIKCFFCLPNWTNSHNWVSISNLLSWVNLFLTRLLMLVSGINCSGMKSDVTN